jgi:pimeloyl-ACP methyl ester carboxylesterase
VTDSLEIRDLEVRGLQLRVRIAGPANGAPVLLVHGWMDTGRSFDRLVPLLHAAGYQTHALDLRGHGDSSWVQPGGFYHFVDYLGDIDGALDALELPGPIHFIGHSMGGALGMIYAAARPDRISRAALLDGMPLLIKASEIPDRLTAYLDDLKTIPRVRRTVPSLAHAAERLRKVSPALQEDAALLLAEAGVSPDPNQGNQLAWKWDPWLRAHSPIPLTEAAFAELLPRIKADLLILRADHTWLPEADELKQRLSRLTAPLAIESVKGTSHHLHIEKAEEVAARILDAWKEM